MMPAVPARRTHDYSRHADKTADQILESIKQK
jgi:hypothetical protein